jgi:hypothetical protein
MSQIRSDVVHAGLAIAAAVAMQAAAAAETALALSIAPGKFDEHCLRLEAGEAITWRFSATGAVDFNIHLHQGDKVLYPVRRDGVTRASGTFRARSAEDYCLMWTNRGAAAVSVRGTADTK